MITIRHLLRHLAELGIDRSERVLVDWRQKSLLPPLKKVGLGRGKGTAQYWDSDVLDQVVACHIFLEHYRRSEGALAALWLSGFEVEQIAGRDAWLRHIQNRQTRFKRGASRRTDGFWSIGESWVKQLPESIPRSEPIESLVKELPTWLYSQDGDSESLHLALVEFFSILAVPRPTQVSEKSEIYEKSKRLVDVLQPEKFLQSEYVIERVSSISETEAGSINSVLKCFREAISHWCRVVENATYRQSVEIATQLMHRLLGPLLVHGILLLRESYPELPIEESVRALHRFIMGVKSTNIQQHKCGPKFSQRFHDEWREAKGQIEQLWTMPQS